jgi:hypothetical protein
MTDLPPSLSTFAALLDAQPEPVRQAFNYCLALMMVEAGKAHLAETLPGEAGQVYTFETITGEQFSLARPALSHLCRAGRCRQEAEAEVREIVRGILGEEG